LAQTETQVVAAELERVSDKVPTCSSGMRCSTRTSRSAKSKRSQHAICEFPSRFVLVASLATTTSLAATSDAAKVRRSRKATVSTVNFKYAVEWHKKTQWATDDARKSVVSIRQASSRQLDEGIPAHGRLEPHDRRRRCHRHHLSRCHGHRAIHADARDGWIRIASHSRWSEGQHLQLDPGDGPHSW
jgi:hypothetical protein